MKNKKTFKVVMLPTEKLSNIGLNQNDVHNKKRLYLNDYPVHSEKQHLYIISNDEIKEGFFYNEQLNRIDEIDHFEISSGYRGYRCKSGTWVYVDETENKVVASTDKLSIKDGTFNSIKWEQNTKLLPQLPESFIHAYIKAYNDGKPITEVALEMEKKCFWKNDSTGEMRFDVENNPSGDNTWTYFEDYLIKTRPDGSVVIHQSKVYSEYHINMAIREAIMYPEKFMTGIVHDDKKSLTWIKEELDKIYK